ncbi:flagellar assembly peptidoglycan hydrolase FlgJ [Pseudoalteromonas sp. MMG010]|uniref:flagellar assembly peptidoglycan hydrolase FlgJ n=1 Tax=Pseudoalteromonas sp. MMG010 TaxID=2822685 RepID=UPI001B3A114D|nr:flagellar assembly peptidoglycan hydrolase FlgJ [Pseudoalteromonas sp. MMG010]MBQ4831801.1 flagellar assembly peptidoglycan hydrolase FlgJ [Pseudoalteromonas sp. MMG010]
METNHLENQSFFDLSNLNNLRSEALNSGDASSEASRAALKKAAAQFESIFTQMLFKSMRQANEAFEDEDNPLNSSSVKFFEDMHDQQMSTELSSNGSLGLADLIVQQLSPDGEKYQLASVFRTGNDIASSQMINNNNNNTNEAAENKREAVDSLANSDNQQSDVTSSFNTTKEFVSHVWEHAKEAAQKIGLNPAVMVAQAALETGWGKHVINKSDGSSSNNLFNIKSDSRWEGDKASKVTVEFENGTAVKKQASFRAYESIKDSVNDFVDFLTQNPRYEQALQTTHQPEQFLDELQKAGYATDPNYANKIKSVLNSAELKNIAATIIRPGAQ